MTDLLVLWAVCVGVVASLRAAAAVSVWLWRRDE